MNAAQLIVELEKLDPDTVMLIPTGDFWGSYRAPDISGNGFLCDETSPGSWADVSDQERDRDQTGMSL